MKPILLGMNNPQSSAPELALYPDPPGCAGYNLCKLLGMGTQNYLDLFERRNLLQERLWSAQDAAAAAETYRDGHDGERLVVILGEDVANLLWHTAPPFQWVQRAGGGAWAKMPHPSGRCRHWNDQVIRRAAEIFLQELAETSS